MQKIINKGFTLIELLVVIAIIGILAAIVLVSLGSARTKGGDAGIQGNLDTVRSQAEIYANNNGYYNPASAVGALGGATQAKANAAAAGCGIGLDMWTDSTINQAITNASNQSGLSTLNGTAGMASICIWGPAGSAAKAATWWVVAVPLKSNNLVAWCVDNSGQAKQETIIGTFDTAASVNTTSGLGKCP